MDKQYVYQFNFDASNPEDVKNIVSRALSEYERQDLENKIKNSYSIIEVPFVGRRIFVNMAFAKFAIESEYVETKEEETAPVAIETDQVTTPVIDVA
jgi:hypothetical protein